MKLNKRGFSFIELVAVLAVLSIILLITVPEFSPYQSYSRDSKIKQEISSVEYQAKKVIVQNNLAMWKMVEEEPNVELWTSKGLVKELEQGVFLEIPSNIIETELKGGFYLMNGRVYYSMSKLGVIEQPEEPDPIEPEPVIVNKEKLLSSINIAKGLNEEDYESGFLALNAALSNAEKAYLDKQSSQAKIDRLQLILDRAISQLVEIPPIKWKLATDNDFNWETEFFYGYRAYGQWFRGYYKYTGNDEYVIIPDVIKGNRMDDYRRMFEGNKTIKGVSNTSLSINQFYRTFQEVELQELDLSDLNVSNAKDFTQMFYKAKINSFLKLDNWDTSSGIYMNEMFLNSTIQEINFGNFKIDNVSNMTSMFSYTTTNNLDLTKFNLDKSGLNMSNMFRGINVNKIYVKNKSHKNKIVSSGGANTNKVFIK